MVSWLIQLIPTLGTLLFASFVVVVGRLVLRKTVSDTRTLPFRRQFFTLIVALVGLFVAIALVPVSADVRTQILGVLGILLSAIIALSSTTLVGNAMAGIMLRLTRGFRAGDFVQAGDLVGRIADIGLLHCEVQKITRDIAVVPNSVLIRDSISVTRRAGTFVNAAVSAGYTVHRSEVESLLIEAAHRTELTEPFVFVDELLDHAIRYRVYGLLVDPGALLSKTSDLKKAIIDVMTEKGISVASPSLVDRRELEPQHKYAPPRTSFVSEEKPEVPVEEIAFDRAEEAESIERLYAIQKRLHQELRGPGSAGGVADEDTDGRQSANWKTKIEDKLKRIALEIEKREQSKKDHEIDEETSG